MAKIATPSWRSATSWNGDPEPIFAAAAAAARLLEEANVTFVTSVDIDWGDGKATEESIAAAREALRFAQTPQSIEVYFIRHPQDQVDAGFEAAVVSGQPFSVRATARGASFELTQRIVDAMQLEAAAAAPPEETDEAGITPDMTVVLPRPAPQEIHIPFQREGNRFTWFLEWI